MNDFDYSIHYHEYHDGSEEHFNNMAKSMASILAPMLPPERDLPVVDIGCGHGFALEALRRLGFTKLEGVEVSKERADVARRHGFNVTLVADTAEWLATRHSQYALVILFDVLEHVAVASQIALLRRIRDCLVPGGRLLIQDPNASSILAARWRYNDFMHYSSFTEHSLHFALRNAGFDDIEIDDSKGLGSSPPKTQWRAQPRQALRKYLVRWIWWQICKAELYWESIDKVSFELNLKATAFRRD